METRSKGVTATVSSSGITSEQVAEKIREMLEQGGVIRSLEQVQGYMADPTTFVPTDPEAETVVLRSILIEDVIDARRYLAWMVSPSGIISAMALIGTTVVSNDD